VRSLRTIIAALLVVMLFNSTTALACGPFMIEAVFVHTVHPSYPLERFAAGKIGVLQPTYARSYLYVAYRHLADSPFTPGEQQALTQLWKERLEFGSSTSDEDLINAWLVARKKVASDTPTISPYRSREKPNEWESYLNCQKDAFDTAATTLNERIETYGAQSPAVKTWVAAQDEVFSNCGGGSVIPAQLPAEADALMRADRAYQVAAANFYAANFAEAKNGFEAIAADAKSPWQHNAAYLVARALARKGSLGPAEQRQESLGQAEAQLRKILADKSLSSSHAPATRLLNLVRLRLHPQDRVRELAETLTNKAPNPNLKQDLTDYTVLLDGFLERDEADQAPAESPKEEDLSVPRDEDLTDWIATFQGSGKNAAEHAVARWEATRSNPWLIAALTYTDGKDAKATELISEALRVRNTSAAFISARFQAIRLLMEQGKNAEARKLLDQSFNSDRSLFDESSLNLFTSRRMLLAQSLPEFLADAARVPAALSWNDDGRELPAEDSSIGDERKAEKGKPFFDYDAGHAFNEQMPLSVLKEAVKGDALPPGPRRDLAQATWLRAALLGDMRTANELVPILAELVPELKPLLAKYQASTRPDEKKFSAIYAWLKFPGLEPVVDIGFGREAPLHQQDSYRDNWWCRSSFVPPSPKGAPKGVVFVAVQGPPPAFLTPAQVQKGASEAAALRALGAAPNYISREVIDYANRRPTDPRVPEALHIAVRTTRYGCTDKDTVRWSKAAYDVLHKKYPDSPWAKKTPYWFKD
ncbi:MAG TPA: hypothetical protein VFT02_00250, partial [Pyrinomonadaceae bacterium]|nr:hypothetical protein [Pyrinomonadaceae bacterium]